MPKKFYWPIVGHKKIVDFLQHSIEKDQLSHAYIFYGAPHLGKRTVVEYFAKSIFCNKRHIMPVGSSSANRGDVAATAQWTESVPCQKCVHCDRFDDKIHADLVIIKRMVDGKTGKLKKSISIEQIREAKNRLSLSSSLKNYKIAIIEDAQKLSLGAANSLLKILEEPSGNTIFILLASKIDILPKTIISRCQKIKFLPVPFSDIYNYLVQRKKINRAEALNLATLAQGKPGLANYFLSNENLRRYYQELRNCIKTIEQSDYQKIESIGKELSKVLEFEAQKGLALIFLTKWRLIIRDLLLIKNTTLGAEMKIMIIHNDFTDILKKIAQKYSNGQLINLLDKIKKSMEYLDSNASPRLVIENFILSL